jgi:hypothetical protein
MRHGERRRREIFVAHKPDVPKLRSGATSWWPPAMMAACNGYAAPTGLWILTETFLQ